MVDYMTFKIEKRKDKDGYCIIGKGVSGIRNFKTVKSAKEHIDFLVSNSLDKDPNELRGL